MGPGRLFLGILILSSLLLARCTSSERLEHKRGVEAAEAKDFQTAVDHFQRVLRKSDGTELAKDAASRAAHILYYEMKDFDEALKYYKYLIVHSSDLKVQKEAQTMISEIVFDHLADYKQAITEFSRLLELPHTPSEEIGHRVSIAKAYFYLSNFYQAHIEIDRILEHPRIKDDDRFDPLLLKANIYLGEKKIDEAIQVFEKIIENYPERAKKENIAVNLAICYEEKKMFDKSIELLEEAKAYYPTPEFLDIRIQRLKIRKSYLPGARGLRK